MKIIALWVFLLVTAFPLAGQTKSIYVPPVTGTGSGPEDNAYIRNLLTSEVRAQNFILAQTLQDADYALMGTIIDREMYYSYNFGVNMEDVDADFDFGGLYVLHLVLQDNHNGEIEVEQDLLYYIQEDIDTFFPVVSYYIFSRITNTSVKQTADTGEDDLWRHKRWYFSAGVFWTPSVYVGRNQPVFWGNFSFGLSVEYRLLSFLSVETGIGLTPEWIRDTKAGVEDRNMLLEIPLSFKFVVRPGSHSMLEPYTGMHFNIPLMELSNPLPVSWRLGLQYGIKVGPCIIYLDSRFAVDLGTLNVEKNIGTVTVTEYQRYTAYIGIGYKFGVGTGP
jgi:hypothetical protein